MVVKSKKLSKKKIKTKAKVKAKSRTATRSGKTRGRIKPVRKTVAKSRSRVKAGTKIGAVAKFKAKQVFSRPISRPPVKFAAESPFFARPVPKVVKRVLSPAADRKPASGRTPRIHQFSYMKAPGLEHEFEVGDSVEVFCDHEKNRERIRGWVKGIVVQVDNKMVAVQFRSNVFLTDGWMVPDRILWYPVNSEHIRPVPSKKPVKKDLIPDY